MTAQEIIIILKKDGIELLVDGSSIRVRAHKANLTDHQKALISQNKIILLAHLAVPPGERNCGSIQRGETAPIPTVSEQSSVPGTHFKKYTLPNGEELQLTKDEFYRVVDVFRLLNERDTKLCPKRGVA